MEESSPFRFRVVCRLFQEKTLTIHEINFSYKKLKKLSLLPFIVLMLTACVKTVFEHYAQIPDNTWKYADVKQFDVQINQDGLYDISVLVRNTDEYAWNNLWVMLE